MASRRFDCADGWTLAGRMLDRRDTARTRTPRLVRVDHDGHAALARCRDVSDIGMKLDLTEPLAINDFVTVAFSPAAVLPAVVVWVKGRECGIAFAAPLDSSALLDGFGTGSFDLPATLALLGTRQRPCAGPAQPAAADHSFHPGLAVTLMAAPGFEERATISWTQGNIAALTFAPREAPNG